MSFSDLKKQSKLGSLTSKLVREVEKMNTTSGGDDRLWRPEVDKSGNGYAVIRFLPAPEGEDIPWVKMYSHAFQGPGGWYMENSLTTLGSKDPVSEHNSRLWNSGIDSDKEVARKQKRKLSYYANVYIVKDPANPSNEGEVFLYKFGKKIFDKIQESMQPEFEDENAINPFDFWQGADFKIKIKKVAGFWNYDSSEFAAPSALLSDDEALEAIWKKEYSLQELISSDKFKSYDDLKTRLAYVLGNKSKPATVVEEDTFRGELEDLNNTRQKAPEPVAVATASHDEDEDDALSYFQRLAEE
tara:strand:+ start:212 stop:1111 length:900 start_codon:yes stop_codon:yes gene_type:complete